MPDADGVVEIDETVRLERGENILELNVTRVSLLSQRYRLVHHDTHVVCTQVSLTEEAVRVLDDTQPAIFCTWDFYDFETQATPIMKGIRYIDITSTKYIKIYMVLYLLISLFSNEYNFSSLYTVKVDDFFLQYLHKVLICKMVVEDI